MKNGMRSLYDWLKKNNISFPVSVTITVPTQNDRYALKKAMLAEAVAPYEIDGTIHDFSVEGYYGIKVDVRSKNIF